MRQWHWPVWHVCKNNLSLHQNNLIICKRGVWWLFSLILKFSIRKNEFNLVYEFRSRPVAWKLQIIIWHENILTEWKWILRLQIIVFRQFYGLLLSFNDLKEISYEILCITRCSVFKLYLHWKIMMSTHFLCLYFLQAIALKPLLNKCVASFCCFCYKSLLMRSSCILLILSSHNL